jgi:hypothetical protein
MQTQNENSSLKALRGLHEIEKRRQREAEQARAKAEKDRLARAEAQVREARLAREVAERQAAEAFERTQTARLGRELDTARAEIAHLRGELEKAFLAQSQTMAVVPATSRGVRTLSWLGITAGVTMLVGALALAAAMQPGDRPVATAVIATSTTKSPRVEAPVLSPIAAKPAPSIEPSPPKLAPRPRPATAKRPPRGGKVKSKVGPTCDPMLDPLCGIDPNVSDEAGKRHSRRHR